MIVETEITKRLFIGGVLALALIPRQHIDKDYFSIGGDLSRPFKRLLLAHGIVNFLRFLLKDSAFRAQIQFVADALGIIQQIGLVFGCLLTPYILQTFLAGRINLPGGRPGANLVRPLYATAFLSVLGVILSRSVSRNFWCLRKLASVVATPFVLQTLKLYNRVTTVGGHHASRGTLLCQTLATVEYWNFVIQLLSAVGFAFLNEKDYHDYTQWDHLLHSFRDIGFVADWTRVAMHAIFLNLLDELYLSSAPSRHQQMNNPQPDHNHTGTTNDDASTEIVSFLPA